MTDPLTFPTTTPKVGLPLLFVGQAQKEFFVNQALAILDALMPGVVQASLTEPPVAPMEGETYRVLAPAAAGWAGCEDHLAVQIGGSWHFVPPEDGMVVFDQAAAVRLLFRSGWHTATAPALPVGGAVIDIEVRAALAGLIAALQAGGLLG